MSDDLISRQDAKSKKVYSHERHEYVVPVAELDWLPSAQSEPHYCRECKWGRCHINVDKHSKSETYWRCLNWDGETDEEGYCYEWERRTE